MTTTPTQSESLAAAMAAMTALTNAADSVFITQATNVIADLVSQGRYQAWFNHSKYVSFQNIATYFRNLGYIVGYPICSNWENGYYGYPYFLIMSGYFAGRNICCCGKCRIYISWQNAYTPYPPNF